MTDLVAFHPKTNGLALLVSYGDYWVGSLMCWATHQNGESPYGFVFGYYKTLEEGMTALTACLGDEF